MHRTITYQILSGRRKDKARLLEMLESCRQLYNAALQERRDAWTKQQKSISYFDQCKEFTGIRAISKEYQQFSVDMVRMTTFRRLDKAFQAFFRRVKNQKKKSGYPRFKGKDRFNTLTFTNHGWKIVGNKLKLQGIGWFRVSGKSKYDGNPVGLHIIHKADRWYARVFYDVGEAPKQKSSINGVGIDVGLKTFATLSNGKQIKHPKFLKASLDKLAKANQRLARRKHGSNRRKEAKRLLARTHLKIANQRKNFIHKVTRELINTYDGFAVEDLEVQKMVQGPKFLRRGIMDSGWSLFFSALAYKAEEAGMPVVKVNPRGTTQNCSNCGTLVRKGLADRWHSCSVCGLKMDRDLNAAKNILSGAVSASGFAPRSLVSLEA